MTEFVRTVRWHWFRVCRWFVDLNAGGVRSRRPSEREWRQLRIVLTCTAAFVLVVTLCGLLAVGRR